MKQTAPNNAPTCPPMSERDQRRTLDPLMVFALYLFGACTDGVLFGSARRLPNGSKTVVYLMLTLVAAVGAVPARPAATDVLSLRDLAGRRARAGSRCFLGIRSCQRCDHPRP